MVARLASAALFVLAVVASTVLSRGTSGPARPGILVGDFHVHAFPGDGALSPAALRREAAMRGLDVVALTNHNHALATSLARITGQFDRYPLLIPGEEITTPRFHMIAVGVAGLVPAELSARETIAAVHRQGGVAIAAHPINASWGVTDAGAVADLDGAEVAHPTGIGRPRDREELHAFFTSARTLNPHIAPIGSTDFHFNFPLGLCRTYVFVDSASVDGVLDAIRRGRTVAATPDGELTGAPDLVARVRAFRQSLAPPARSYWNRVATVVALLALAGLVTIRT